MWSTSLRSVLMSMPPAPPGRKQVAARRPRPAKLQRVAWPQAWRIIASRFPPIDLFERLSPKQEVWAALIALEEATNPRWRDLVGDISLVPPERRVTGTGGTNVMAPFTHVNPKGSRFSDGSYGVYYCAESLGTAVAETVFHFEQFARESKDEPRTEDMRVLVGPVERDFHAVSTVSKARQKEILDPNSYDASRPFGRALREEGSEGIVYASVRRRGGECVGAFWPNAVGIPRQERHLKYHWNGERVDKYFDYQSEEWIDL